MTETQQSPWKRAEPSAIVHPAPLSSLVASAKRLTSKSVRRGGKMSTLRAWQEDAWEMYDLVGEQRFLSSTLAGRMSQANFYVGRVTDDPTVDPEPLPLDHQAATVLHAIGGSASGRAQLIQRLGVNLFVAGDAWLAGIPRYLMPAALRSPGDEEVERPAEVDPDSLPVDDLEWKMLSVSEVASHRDGQVTLMMGDGEGEQVKCLLDEIFLIRVWRPHPRRWWEADSPTRSSLSVLRELVGLTMHISAQVDSRLAGAGLLVVPQSAQRALNVAAGLEPETDSDQFTEALMEAMLTPIGDRANASALVPLVVTVPDEVTAMFNYMTFAKPLDSEARSLRDEAIRRLALGQDAPPELLLGTGGMNHWGAWLVREDVVSTHLEPPLALICDALTTQYLWPVLMQQGMTQEQASEFVVWYDVSHMIMRPNRSGDALVLHERGAIGDKALRDATGFSEEDAPTLTMVDAAILDMVKANPALLYKPGVNALREQMQAIADGKDIDPLQQASAKTKPAPAQPAAPGEAPVPAEPAAAPEEAPPAAPPEAVPVQQEPTVVVEP
jgi:hypothetical protein